MKLKNCGNCHYYFANGDDSGPFGICTKAIPKCLVHFIDDRGPGCDIDIADMIVTKALDESHCLCWKET